MARISTLTADLVGRRYPASEFMLSAQWVRDYQECLGFPLDDAAPVPLSFVSCLRDSEFGVFTALGLELPQLLHAGQSYKFYERLRVGDIITSQCEISKVLVKKGRSADMVLLELQSLFRRGEGLIAEATMNVLVRDLA